MYHGHWFRDTAYIALAFENLGYSEKVRLSRVIFTPCLHQRPAWQGQVAHNEARAREQLPRMMLDLRCHSSRRRPALRPIEKCTRRINMDQQSRNQKPHRKRRGERGGPGWERTLPACSAFLTPRTQDACAPRKTHKNPLQKAKDFRVSSTEPSREAEAIQNL